jgi:glycosyltransferase involved in cell wall biosynthesis
VDAPESRLWARLKYRPYSRIVALSRAIEAQLGASGIEPARIVRIPSAVDGQRYRPDERARARLLERFGLPADAVLVGVVAQLIPRKRHALLLAELPALVRREPRMRVLCFGRGPLEMTLRSQIAALGLERHALLPGYRADLPALLPGLDVLVHPAEREGLGVAVLEAASCALPVVAAAAGGVVDVLEHGRTGLLFPANDGGALAAQLLALIADPVQRRRLGDNARAHVAQRFDVAALADAHVALYSAILSDARSSRATQPVVGGGMRTPSP